MRKVGAQVTPTIEIHRNGDLWTIKTLTTFKNTEISFRLGVEFDEVTPDGRKCKVEPKHNLKRVLCNITSCRHLINRLPNFVCFSVQLQ